MPDLSPRQLRITNSLGLHLRAAGRFVQLALQFQSDVRISCDGRTANGKSILDLMALAAGCGAWLEIEVSGPDAEEATTQLCALIEEGLHEDEGGRVESPGV